MADEATSPPSPLGSATSTIIALELDETVDDETLWRLRRGGHNSLSEADITHNGTTTPGPNSRSGTEHDHPHCAHSWLLGPLVSCGTIASQIQIGQTRPEDEALVSLLFSDLDPNGWSEQNDSDPFEPDCETLSDDLDEGDSMSCGAESEGDRVPWDAEEEDGGCIQLDVMPSYLTERSLRCAETLNGVWHSCIRRPEEFRPCGQFALIDMWTSYFWGLVEFQTTAVPILDLFALHADDEDIESMQEYISSSEERQPVLARSWNIVKDKRHIELIQDTHGKAEPDSCGHKLTGTAFDTSPSPRTMAVEGDG